MKQELKAAFRNKDEQRPACPIPRPNRNAGNSSRPLSPVTLRLTATERVRLESLADGMTLSAYIRACIFGEEERRRKSRPKDIVADKKVMAEALALLGQSRIANNLNQLAYQANIGALVMEETERAQIDDAYQYIAEMRSLLIKALKS